MVHMAENRKSKIENGQRQEDYTVLARRYRPQGFGDLVGQEAIARALVNALKSNRVAHAYLFTGARGVGKTSTASNLAIDDVREIRGNVQYAPSRSRFKIYIIDEVHMLSTPAFNALLKTLEEPPPHVKFIFATTEPQKVLPTIVSRCQRFDFAPIEMRSIVERLQHIAKKEKIKLEPPAAQ